MEVFMLNVKLQDCKKGLLSLIILVALSNILFCQQKGIFETQINFQGSNRTIGYYVPESYEANKSYPLIIGMHCGGCSGIMMRSMLQQVASNLDAILACPDDPNYDGKIIPDLLNSVKQNYNIDNGKVIVSGYSMGGTPTFHYGFTNTKTLAGIIGIAPAVNNYSSLNYSLTKNFPVGIIVGANDDFIDVVHEMRETITRVNGRLKYIEKNNVGHIDPYFSTKEFVDDWIECYNFILNIQPSDINEIEDSEKVQIVPNPINNQGTILLKGLIGNINISLFDCLGNEIDKLYSGFNPNDLLEIKLERENKGTGFYFIKIQTETTLKYLKIIIVN
jgi:hypothetical protein